MTTADANQLAVRYLLAARTGKDDLARGHERDLAALDPVALASALREDAFRKAFWIDLYNAAVQRQTSYDFTSRRARGAFFRRPVATVAGKALSLDAIEHGILRRSRWKLGLGYAGNPRPSTFERTHRVERIDPRIHFALNCEAASCPPIAAYHAERVDRELEVATRAYLAREVHTRDGTTTVPTVMLWFIGDFGGPAGLRRFLRIHDVSGWGGRLRFSGWDWTPRPGAWVEELPPPPDEDSPRAG
jgi:hypothetical protein